MRRVRQQCSSRLGSDGGTARRSGLDHLRPAVESRQPELGSHTQSSRVKSAGGLSLHSADMSAPLQSMLPEVGGRDAEERSPPTANSFIDDALTQAVGYTCL